MTVKNKARVSILLAAAWLPAFPLCAAKMSSPGFLDISGISGLGSAVMQSASFELDANMQEVAVSTQEAGSFSQRSGKLAFFPPPSPVADMRVVLISTYSVRLTWTAPSEDISRQAGAPERYTLRYTTSAAIGEDGELYGADAYPQAWIPLAAGSAEVKVLEGFNPGTTYYFSVETVNGHRLFSERANPGAIFALAPLAPMNFKTSRTGNDVKLTWIPPAGYRNRMAFNDTRSPAAPLEVKAYRVFRATAPAASEWQFIAELSSDTFSCTDSIGDGEMFYYHARAVNLAGASEPSLGRDSLSGGVYFLAPDNQSVLEVAQESAGPFFSGSSDPMAAYAVEITAYPEDIGGRVVKSVGIKAYRGGLQADESFRLSGKGVLKLYYRKGGSGILPSEQADAKALSVYYHNGSRWLQMYGNVSEPERSVQLETGLLGRYQLRTTERVGGFSADRAGLTNRLITPNGDGKNDTMVYIFDNPQNNKVSGKIYDLRGALVAVMRPGPIGNSLVWDAKAGGRTVPGGVYIYQLESPGGIYNGTVAVIR